MLSAKAFLDFSMRSSEPNNAKSRLFTISLRVGIITMHFQVKLAWLQFLIAIRSAIPLAACLVFVLLCLKSDELPNREKTTSEGLELDTHSCPLHTETHPRCGCWDRSQTFKAVSKTRSLFIHRSSQLEQSLCFFSKQIYLEMFCHCLWECVREANVWTDTVETGDV